MDFEIISIIAFFVLIGIYLLKRRKEFEFHYGIIIKRWKKGGEKIDELVKGRKKILKKVGNIFVAIGILISFATIYFLIYYTLRLQQIFAPVLPSIAGVKYPEPVIAPPFWYWLIGIFIVIASHETMHAIFSRVENVKLKSYGLLFFFLLPIGAFVDPIKKEFRKLKRIEKMRIYAAGSFGNILVFAFMLLLTITSTKIIDSLIESVGLSFEVLPNTPAEKAGIEGMMFKIDNQTIKGYADLSSFLENRKPGENVTIFTTKGKYIITLAEHPKEKNKSFIGVSKIKEVYKFKMLFAGDVPEVLISSLFVWYNILFWVAILNLGVGIANLLPVKPLDGGYLFEEIFRKFFGKKGKTMTNTLAVIILLLLLFNIFIINIIKT